jgi:uncharacterized RDD family membrane protein YckC
MRFRVRARSAQAIELRPVVIRAGRRYLCGRRVEVIARIGHPQRVPGGKIVAYNQYLALAHMSMAKVSDAAAPLSSLTAVTAGPQRVAAPLLRRLVAFGVDFVIIGSACSIAGLVAAPWFSALGPTGPLVGGLIGICYFGIGGSRLATGQTIGKRLTGVTVRHTDGIHLRLPVALLRATLLMIPFAFNDLPRGSFSPNTLVILRSLAAGIGGATVYLFVCNRETGQLLHDIATRSIVGQFCLTNPEQTCNVIRRRHAVVISAIFTAGTILSWVTTARDSGNVDAWDVAQTSIRTVTGAASVTMIDGASTRKGRREAWTGAEVVTYVAPPDAERLANSIAAIILRDMREARGRNRIDVTVTHGYDLLFASSWQSQTWSYTPIEWGQRLRKQP